MNNIDRLGRNAWDTEIGTALLAADVDTTLVTVTPDGDWTVTRADGTRFVLSDDGVDEDGQDWWIATEWTADGEAAVTHSFADLGAAASAIATWISA